MWGTAIANTWYIYDASGALQATYFEDLTVTTPTPVVQDYPMYGGGRMGVYDAGSTKPYFELNDHLGNIRTVFTDNAGAAQALAYTDYYPHGGIMPGSHHVSSPGYRYNYQGQEKDNETGLLNFELRQFDARTARWLNPDPYGQHYSPYLSMSNNPINAIDPDGGLDWFATSALQNSNLMADINYNGRNWHNMTPFERNVVQAENGIGYEEFYKDRFFTAASFAGGYKARDGSIYNLGGDGWLTKTTQHHYLLSRIHYPNGQVSENYSIYTTTTNIGKVSSPKDMGVIRSFTPNKIEKIKNYLEEPSDNVFGLLGKITGLMFFNIADDAYKTMTGLYYGPDMARSITGQGVNRTEYTKAGLNTYVNFMPVRLLKTVVADIKILNIAQFNKTYKGTYMTKGTSAERGARLLIYNQGSRNIKSGVNTGIKIFGTIETWGDVNDASNQIYKK